MKRSSRVLACSLIVLSPLTVRGQEMLPTATHQTIPEQMLSFFAPFVIPKIFQDVHRLREYVRSGEFSMLRTVQGDLCAVDRIFLKSLEITWSNYYEALLICTWAVMDHRTVGINLPVIGSLFWLPLTSEFPDEFDARLASLPRRLYPDSPVHSAGDRDKLQHFFGSAFIQYITESAEGAERVGNFVEYGESAFIVGGRFDERDLRANQHGRSFGGALLRGHPVLPSDFLLLLVVASSEPISTFSATGTFCGAESPDQWEDR